MCFHANSKTVIRVASEDIKVYKVLIRDSEGVLRSPFKRKFKWLTKTATVKKFLRIIPRNRTITKGLHSFIKVNSAKRLRGSDNVYEAIIPRGSLYLKNNMHYVSETLKIVRKLK